MKNRLFTTLSSVLLSIAALVDVFSIMGYSKVQVQPAVENDTDITTTNVFYVDTDAPAGGDGLSWETAYTHLQDALDHTNANNNHDYEIWVAEGIYTPGNARTDSFLITQTVKLYGGFNGTETTRDQRDWSANPTILSGDIDENDITENGVVTDTANITGSNAYHVIYLDGTTANGPITSTTVIDGFTITAGSADGAGLDSFGGGFFGNGSGSGNACSPTLTNVTFSGNFGGGMYNAGYNGGESNPTLIDVIFVSNSADFGGGMLNSGYNGTSNPTLEGVTFSDNSASTSGGGMYNFGQNGVSSPSLTDVTFSGNSAIDGGGMYNAGYDSGESNPTLNNVTLSDNTASDDGGGMFNNGESGESSPSLADVTFSGNSAASSGAGMFNTGNGHGVSSPTLDGVTFSGNTASYGGGMYNTESSSNLTNVTFRDNTASDKGGGMYSGPTRSESSIILVDVTFSNNSADYGGGMYNWSSSPTLINVSFRGNYAGRWGGGMQNYGSGDSDEASPTLINVTFSGNRADVVGGGMSNYGSESSYGGKGVSSPMLINVTFSGNYAGHGGGMKNNGAFGISSPTLVNCILWGNTAPQMYNDQASPTVNYSLVQGGCPTGAACDGNLITTDPQFVAPVDASSAPTTTGDYHLQGASPAIDAGDNTAVTVTVDLDGNPRVVNGVVDMGAYEYQGYPEITVTPSILDFGDQELDTGPSASQTVTIKNDGSADLQITSVSLTGADAGEFAIESDSGEVTLTPGSTHTVQVSFDPSTTGAKSAQLTIQSNDNDEPTVDVSLSGTGITELVFLPIVLDAPGPPTAAPTLDPIDNPNGDYDYTVTWSSIDKASEYTLQEDDNADFSTPITSYQGALTSIAISDQDLGTYYYRVKVSNQLGESDWSNVISTTVTVEKPSLSITLESCPDDVDVHYVTFHGVLVGYEAHVCVTVPPDRATSTSLRRY